MKNWTRPEVSELEVSLTANGGWDSYKEKCYSNDDLIDDDDDDDDRDVTQAS